MGLKLRQGGAQTAYRWGWDADFCIPLRECHIEDFGIPDRADSAVFLQLPSGIAKFQKCTFSAIFIFEGKVYFSRNYRLGLQKYRIPETAGKFQFPDILRMRQRSVWRSIHARTLSLGASFRLPIQSVGKSARFISWYAHAREMPSIAASGSAFSTPLQILLRCIINLFQYVNSLSFLLGSILRCALCKG